ncbi:MAG TPA: tRNA uridine-5-carboxymethylaminomethyl(34) synthesis GTPase MnmE [Terriglobales bacterium]
MNLDDTIVAIATPPGRGGIGVVRIAGALAREIALPMLHLKHALEPGRAIFTELIDPTVGSRSEGGVDSRIDEVMVTYFAKPHSYTTDDIIEISAHGSPVVLRHIVEMAVARDARIAEPGEFTMRAFLNGRIDLAQAEAVRDLIDSQTLYQAKVAAQQLGGALSRRLQPIKQMLVELIAVLEAGIDFAEDDIAVLPSNQIIDRIGAIRRPLEELAASFAYGKIVHEGLTLAIVGRPNVGKSSLFNRLVERDRAIVTATPGTTRDLVSETVAIGGIPVKLIDTAGIRSALDEAESIGIRKSMEALADADLVLVVLDASQPTAEDSDLLAEAEGRPVIVIENKCDLAGEKCVPDVGPSPSGSPTATMARVAQRVRTSAITGAGIDALKAEILHHVSGETSAPSDGGFLTNLRHQRRVTESIAALDAAKSAVEQRIPHEMVLMDLYQSLRALDEITGSTTTDDILNLIFSTFCIGK